MLRPIIPVPIQPIVCMLGSEEFVKLRLTKFMFLPSLILP